MTHALFITAYDRPNYLREVLKSWGMVRGLKGWRVVARIEPGLYTQQNYDLFDGFRVGKQHPDFEIVVNPERYGVLHHPWVGFEELFAEHDFVVRAEDDLRVSDDILEYFSWAAQEFEMVDKVASVHGFTRREVGDAAASEILPRFDPLVWGTWRGFWEGLFSPTWDHDYSTFNGTPGNQSGWDWNINTRLYPHFGLHGLFPEASRVDNIGIYGTHSTPENFYTAPTFTAERGFVDYAAAANLRV
jgi:hypothetical protein